MDMPRILYTVFVHKIASLYTASGTRTHLTSMLGSTSSQPGLAGVVQEGSTLVVAWSV